MPIVCTETEPREKYLYFGKYRTILFGKIVQNDKIHLDLEPYELNLISLQFYLNVVFKK